MRAIRIESLKYDGSKHYRFDATVLRDDGGEIWTYTPPGIVLDSYRGMLKSVSHSLRVFWPDRHWNLFMRWKPDWTWEDYYVNVATPAVWDAERIAWTDLDLDIVWRSRDAEPFLDDADEFEVHSLQWQYPTELVERCWATVNDVTELMRRRAWPFDGSLVAFRPPEGVA